MIAGVIAYTRASLRHAIVINEILTLNLVGKAESQSRIPTTKDILSPDVNPLLAAAPSPPMRLGFFVGDSP